MAEHPPEDARVALPTNLAAKSYFTLKGCRVTRDQLDRIWRLAGKGFSSDAYVTVKTKRKSSGVESEITGNSIDHLLNGVRQATLPGDPKILENIDLYISDSTLGGSARSVAVRISTKGLSPGVRTHVSGPDPGWVRGRIGELKDLLKETQAPFLTGRGHIRLLLLTASMALAGLVNFLLNVSVMHHQSLAVGLFVLIGLWATLGGGGFYVGLRMDRRFRTQLLLFSDNSKPKVDWVARATLLVAILGLIIAVAGIVVAHLDALHPGH